MGLIGSLGGYTWGSGRHLESEEGLNAGELVAALATGNNIAQWKRAQTRTLGMRGSTLAGCSHGAIPLLACEGPNIFVKHHMCFPINTQICSQLAGDLFGLTAFFVTLFKFFI